jgi:hypothetical protein
MKAEDVEKGHGSSSVESVAQYELDQSASNSSSDAAILEKPEIQQPQSRLQRCLACLKGVENRGIERVPLEEREEVTPSTSLHMVLMWFSMTLATNNIIAGSMGTLVLGLSFKDAALCAIFGVIVGASIIGYMSTWGPISGNRTLVCEPDNVQNRVLMPPADRGPLFHGLLRQQSVLRSQHLYQHRI